MTGNSYSMDYIMNDETPRVEFVIYKNKGNWATVGWVHLTDSRINLYPLLDVDEILRHNYEPTFIREYGFVCGVMAEYAEKVKEGWSKLGK